MRPRKTSDILEGVLNEMARTLRANNLWQPDGERFRWEDASIGMRQLRELEAQLPAHIPLSPVVRPFRSWDAASACIVALMDMPSFVCAGVRASICPATLFGIIRLLERLRHEGKPHPDNIYVRDFGDIVCEWTKPKGWWTGSIGTICPTGKPPTPKEPHA